MLNYDIVKEMLEAAGYEEAESDSVGYFAYKSGSEYEVSYLDLESGTGPLVDLLGSYAEEEYYERLRGE